MNAARYLIVRIPQAGGGTRELYAHTPEACREARDRIREDPATIECCEYVGEYVDVEPDGTRMRYVLRGEVGAQ